jgi:hypothetical protein
MAKELLPDSLCPPEPKADGPGVRPRGADGHHRRAGRGTLLRRSPPSEKPPSTRSPGSQPSRFLAYCAAVGLGALRLLKFGYNQN